MQRFHSLSLRDLHSLLVLDATHSLGRAATALDVSVAALSRRLTRIEDSLGITLFERGTGGTVVTKPGRQVLRHARRIMTEANHLVTIIANEADLPDGEIRIGVARPPLHPAIEAWFRAWNERYPRTRIGLYVPDGESIAASLVKRHVDAAILPDCVINDTMASFILYNDKLLAVLPEEHHLAKLPTLPIAKIMKERLLVPVDPHEERRNHFKLDAFDQHGHLVVHTGGIITLLSQVRSGAGIGLTNTACRDLLPSGLAFRPISGLDDSFNVHLAWRAESEDAFLGRFVSFMRTLTRTRSPPSFARGVDVGKPDPPP
ncbi:LysR family transcriptional regulator [Acetobacter senegalensis]|uniref:LysR family transcriptional regulator n=1 Tax=Acetobacter senegalensis TaxID=446692 RepID=UPI0009EE6CEB|nr:LysR family transcriptional regulator [Acetobacter senegalensis]